MRHFAVAPTYLLAALMMLCMAGPAAAKPTDEQVAAIKANCRSDFMSNCWGVPRGGAEAMQCLKEHLAELSPGCQSAVKAISASAASASAPAPKKTETAPAEVPAEPAKQAAPAATDTSPATEATAKPATASPAPEGAPASPPKTLAGTPDKPARSAEPATKPSPSTAHAATKASAPASEPSSVEAPATAPAKAEPAPAIIGFIPPRKKLMVLRNCRQDLDSYCPDVSYGDGRQLKCLFGNKPALTLDCQGALAKLTR